MAKKIGEWLRELGLVASDNSKELTPGEKAQLDWEANFRVRIAVTTGLATEEELAARQRQYPAISGLISR